MDSVPQDGQRPHRHLKIPTIPLSDGTSIPNLAFGTGSVLREKDVASSVMQAVLLGITHLDGAQMYKNEPSLGRGIAICGRKREELYVVTKLDALGESETVEESLKASLSKLGLTYVDLFLVHDPARHPDLPKLWRDMESVKLKGLARSIGVSNFDIRHLEEVMKVAQSPPVINQIEYHPYVAKAAAPLLEYCKANNIVVASYSGMAPLTRYTVGPINEVLQKIARTRRISTSAEDGLLNIDVGQVLTRWLIQKGLVVVTTSSKPQRIQTTVRAVSVDESQAQTCRSLLLTDDEMKAIDDAGASIHKRFFCLKTFNEE